MNVILLAILVASVLTDSMDAVNAEEMKKPAAKKSDTGDRGRDLETSEFVYPVVSVGFPLYGYAAYYNRPYWHRVGLGFGGYHGHRGGPAHWTHVGHWGGPHGRFPPPGGYW